MVLLAGVIAWIWVEIVKSNELIEIANNPLASANQGFSEAISDYRHNHRKFIEVFIPGEGYTVPGIPKSALEGELKEFAPNTFFICGTGVHIKNSALDIGSHEHNRYYAQAYNAKLLELVTNDRP